MDGMICLGMESHGGGVDGALRGPATSGTAGRGATPDARPAMSGTVTAEVGRGHGREGLCHSGRRAGCGLGLAGGCEGSSCSVDKG